MNANQTTQEAQVVRAAVQVPGGRYAYHTVKLYIAKPRADGVLTWRADMTLSGRFRSRAKAIRLSRWDHIDLVDVRHGTVCA